VTAGEGSTRPRRAPGPSPEMAHSSNPALGKQAVTWPPGRYLLDSQADAPSLRLAC